MKPLRLVSGLALGVSLLNSSLTAQEIGQPAPDIQLEHSLQGPEPEALSLSELRGKVVVIDFWATW